MKILISSYSFYPKIGGIEESSFILADTFASKGNDVILITQTPEDLYKKRTFAFEIFRQPGLRKLIDLIKWCNIYFQNNISLQTAWPLLIVRRPWVIAHKTWISRVDGKLSYKDYVKKYVTRFATSIANSQAIAEHISTPSVVIGNPYRDDVFMNIPRINRDKELVYVGRLVSDKGVDLLLRAVGILKERGFVPRLTIVGNGPEETVLHNLVCNTGISDQVDFVGIKSGQELAEILNAHKIMVVPSRWMEPFGIVALEGIACGCVVVGSSGGGLKDAIGPCGTTFTNGDVMDLANTLLKLFSDSKMMVDYTKKAEEHLLQHKRSTVADMYLKVFNMALEKHE